MVAEKLEQIKKLEEDEKGKFKSGLKELFKEIDQETDTLFPDMFKKDQSIKLVEIAEALGYYLAKVPKEKLSVSQIRNVYARVKEKYEPSEVHLLRPLLAYAARKKEVKPLQKILDKALQKVDKYTYDGFRHFFQAILAYHRYYGGGE